MNEIENHRPERARLIDDMIMLYRSQIISHCIQLSIKKLNGSLNSEGVCMIKTIGSGRFSNQEVRRFAIAR
jgi:hypothetical protein